MSLLGFGSAMRKLMCVIRVYLKLLRELTVFIFVWFVQKGLFLSVKQQRRRNLLFFRKGFLPRHHGGSCTAREFLVSSSCSSTCQSADRKAPSRPGRRSVQRRRLLLFVTISGQLDEARYGLFLSVVFFVRQNVYLQNLKMTIIVRVL